MQALSAQKLFDEGQYGMNLQGANAANNAILSAANFGNQALMNQGMFGNQAALDARSAAEREAQINSSIAGQNNQTRISALSPGMNMFSMLGQGLMQTTPRVGGNFTMDDIQRLQDNPELLNAVWNSGIINPETLSTAGVNYQPYNFSANKVYPQNQGIMSMFG